MASRGTIRTTHFTSGRSNALARAVLLNIASMVLISIQPFGLRKIVLVVVAFLCFSALCFADPVLMVRRYSSPVERLSVVLAAAPTSYRELAGGLRLRIANAYFPSLELAISAGPKPDAGSNDGSKTALLPALPSSVFRKASCAIAPVCPVPLGNQPTRSLGAG